MKLIKYSILTAVSIFLMLQVYYFIYPDRTRRGCVLERERMTIGMITYGLFQETIPQTGMIVRRDGKPIVNVPIDELYLSRILIGLKALSDINGREYELEISQVYPEVKNGRFYVDFNFVGQVPASMRDKVVRLRISLSEPLNAVLLPVGGFYKDTGGKWIFLVKGNNAVKRKIKLGGKSPEYFEVIKGLEPGDQVVTSTYESFINEESIDLKKMQRKAEGKDKFVSWF